MKNRVTQKDRPGNLISEIYKLIQAQDSKNWQYIAENPEVRELERQAYKAQGAQDAKQLTNILKQIEAFAATYDVNHLAVSNAVIGETVAIRLNNSDEVHPVQIVDKYGHEVFVERGDDILAFRWASRIQQYISPDGFLIRYREES